MTIEVMEPFIYTVAYLYIGGVVSFLFKWNFSFTEEKDNFGPGSHITVAILWPIATVLMIVDKMCADPF